MKLRFGFFAVTVAAVVGFAFAAADDSFQGAVIKKPFEASGQAKTGSTQILYHGGPVMNQTNSVYVIYYGSAFAATTESIINDFLTGLNGSPEFGVNQTYNEGPDTASVPPTYAFTPPDKQSSGSVYADDYSQGTQLSNKSIPEIVAHAISGGLPSDPNGIYLVITSPDVKVSGFCNSFCAYHTDATVSLAGGGSMHVRYALIPDPTQRCSACNGGIAVYGDTATPNGDMGADTMTDDIMHELSETVTDPDISAWYTQTGAENGDLCNYVYGSSVQRGVNSAGATYHYNATLLTRAGYRQYLIQQIWKNVGAGFCASN